MISHPQDSTLFRTGKIRGCWRTHKRGGRWSANDQHLRLHEDGRLLTTGTHKERGGQSLMLWDRVNKRRKDLLPDVQGRIAAVSPKGAFLVLSKSERDAQKRRRLLGLQIWSLKEGKMLAEYGVTEAGGFAFSPDEKSMSFICSDRSVRGVGLVGVLAES